MSSHGITREKPERLNPGAIIALSLLFLACFLVPALILLNIQRFLEDNGEARSQAHNEAIFPGSFSISSSGVYIKIAPASNLAPQPGEDFLLVAWFNLRKIPALNRRLTLISSFPDGSAFTQGKHGYALAISRNRQGLRPVVYWGDSRHKGRWLTFPEASIAPRTWVMFALSLHKGRLLGLHKADQVTGGGLSLLGGYDLGSGPFHMEPGALILGAPPGRFFRGVIGPVAIFGKKKLAKDLRSVLRRMARRPLSIPADFKDRQVKLWLLDGQRDDSPYRNRVEVIRGSAKEKKAFKLEAGENGGGEPLRRSVQRSLKGKARGQ